MLVTLAACSSPSGVVSSPTLAAVSMPSAVGTQTSSTLVTPSARTSTGPAAVETFAAQQPFDAPGAEPGQPWTSIAWTALPKDSPLLGVRAVVKWRGGYVATGETGIWTSDDGRTWTPLNAALPVVSALVAETTTGLVALAYDPGSCSYPEAVCSPAVEGLALTAWTSPDGLTWTDRGPALGLTGSQIASVAGSSAGVIVVTVASQSALEFSADGISWQSVSVPAVSPQFWCSDAAFGRGRYLLLCPAQTPTDLGDTPTQPEWSASGLEWSVGSAPSTPGRPASMDTLLVGRNGLMATGWIPGAAGDEQWWRSTDGATWQMDSSYGPLGGEVLQGQDQGERAIGFLRADGDRFVALAYSHDGSSLTGAAWTSWNGQDWVRLPERGEPDWPADTYNAVVFPTGMLVGGSWGAAS